MLRSTSFRTDSYSSDSEDTILEIADLHYQITLPFQLSLRIAVSAWHATSLYLNLLSMFYSTNLFTSM